MLATVLQRERKGRDGGTERDLSRSFQKKTDREGEKERKRDKEGKEETERGREGEVEGEGEGERAGGRERTAGCCRMKTKIRNEMHLMLET
jgi:hypothetical protein